MKRLILAAFISLALHALVIFILTGTEISPPVPGAGSGVTRATFVTINSGLAENGKTEEGNQEVAPAEEPAEKETLKKAEPPQEQENKDRVEEPPQEIPEAVKEPVPPEKPENEKKPLVKPDRKPVEKKREAPVKETATEPEVKKTAVKKADPEPEVKEPQEKKADPEPEKDEPEIEKTPEKQDKTPPAESKENTEREEPGENSDQTQESQGNPGDISPKQGTPDFGTSNSAEDSNQIHDIAEGDITRRVTPGYPRASRLRREEGEVIIIAETGGGKVSSTSVEKSSGHQRLDRAALEAVKKWEFGFTGERTVRIPVIFRLRN